MKKTHITLAAAAAAATFVAVPAVKADVNAKLVVAREVVIDTRSEAVKLNQELASAVHYLDNGEAKLGEAIIVNDKAQKALEAQKVKAAQDNAAIDKDAADVIQQFVDVVTAAKNAVAAKQQEIDLANGQIAEIDAKIKNLNAQAGVATESKEAQIRVFEAEREVHVAAVAAATAQLPELNNTVAVAEKQLELEKARVAVVVAERKKAVADELAAVQAAADKAALDVKEWNEAVAILKADVEAIRVKLIKNGLTEDQLRAIIDLALTEAKSDKKVAASAVYRLYNPGLKVHLYTTDFNEYNVLNERGWNQEGVAFQSATEGTPVYRLYNPGLKVHLYTTDANEYEVLGGRGWNKEGVAFNSVKEGKPVYRLYNEGLKKHLYTTDLNEYNVLEGRGWRKEGVAFNSAN
ncbi:hypothetical protein [Streptococcus suis]|uniref:hypothetical protein n=1 Tax=Streptococcus suis TaxID=1307 RepID=UPI000CF66A50|nr:hypothetical protein [Streptococcus suis]